MKYTAVLAGGLLLILQVQAAAFKGPGAVVTPRQQDKRAPDMFDFTYVSLPFLVFPMLESFMSVSTDASPNYAE